MKIALLMLPPLIGVSIAFAAAPAEARNYDCSKAGNAKYTVQTAADSTGLSPMIQQIVQHIGGESALGQFAGLLNGQGGIGAALGGFTGNLFGKS